MLMRFVMGLSDDMPGPQNADYNGDGSVDANDAIAIIRFSLGLQ